ncbi:MAG TPA: DNA polymerase ligase N-terminal domain-containing protein [Candidatus Limnocylindrales bacterium]
MVAGRFVVQRHRARQPHYDFRLEIGGTLVSWAVPKGPTLDPNVRRAAFRVGDHPLEYFDFEGIIPQGDYGAGDVIVWDIGVWEAEPGKVPAPDDGDVHVDLHGEKLRGRFALIRTGKGGRARRAGGREEQDWLLLKKKDKFAVPGWDPDDHPLSVLSGRTNEQVKADPDRLWRSGFPPARAAVVLKAREVSRDELAELDSLGAQGRWHVFDRELRVTNLDKVLFPARGKREKPVTKREFLRYSAQVAPTALPYLRGRALNLNRYPNGAQAKGFWHKQLPDHAPEWLPRWDNPDADRGEAHTYLTVDEPAALVWAANFGGLEWHAWTSRTDAPKRPTYALIDLDPGEDTEWADLLVLARLHRTAFEHLGVTACAKVSGRRGIQIWVPIKPGPDFKQTREWVERLSKTVGAVVPDLISWKWQKSDRAGLARLDYTQNALNKTLVAPYSPRPAPGAPVSAPIAWDELDDPDLTPDRFTIRDLPKRLAEVGDLFRPVLDHPQRLPALA